MFMNVLQNDWVEYIGEELHKSYYVKLLKFLEQEYRTRIIYPQFNEIFNALLTTPYKQCKVVILGQDPYHGPNQAHGLSFSVKPGILIPPSLQNIYKELHTDLGYQIPPHGCLQTWGEQGVLLLNTVLTVRAGQPNSHQGIGWEQLTNQIIYQLNRREKPIVFVLWGKQAQQKQSIITAPHHLIIRSPHPSPLSAYRGFFGSKPFSRINQFLTSWNIANIDWEVPDIPSSPF
jgi:uracil-DNA glycosylase